MMSSLEVLGGCPAVTPDDRHWNHGGVLTLLVAVVTITLACFGLILVSSGGIAL